MPISVHSETRTNLVHVGPLSLHGVVLPFPRILVSVRIRHLAGAGFLAVRVVALVRCVYLVDVWRTIRSGVQNDWQSRVVFVFFDRL